MRWLCSIALLLLCSSFARAQSPYFKKINTNEELSTETIYDLSEDVYGFIYLGTDRGLFRYNGIQFRRIPIIGQQSNALTSVHCLKDGNIVCRNFSGQIFQFTNDTLRPLERIEKDLKPYNILDIRCWEEEIFIATQNGVEVYQLATQQKKYSIPFDLLETIEIDASGRLFVISSNGLLSAFQGQKRLFTSETGIMKGRFAVSVNTLFLTSKDRSNGIIYHLKNEKIIPLRQMQALKGVFINNFSVQHQRFLISTNEGVFVLEGNHLTSVESHQRCADALIDRQGHYWIAGLEEGLKYIPDLNTTYFYLNEPGKKITCISSTDKGFLLGQNKGDILHVDRDGKPIERYLSSQENAVEFVYYDQNYKRIYSSMAMYALGKTNALKEFYYGKGGMSDTAGNFFFASNNRAGIEWNGLSTSFIQSRMATLTVLPETKFISLREKRTRDLLLVPDNSQVYVAYVDGLYVHSENGNSKEILDVQNQSVSVISMDMDDNGKIWLGTLKHGVRTIQGDQIVQHLSIENGLSGTYCRKIKCHRDHLYVLHENGIDQYNRISGEVYPLTEALGINDLLWLDMAFHNDTLLAVTNQGVLRLSTQAIFAPTHTTWIKGIQGSTEALPIPVEIPYADNTVEIVWENISYKKGKRIKQFVRLLPIQTQWSTVNAFDDRIRFNHLPPGEYTFELKTGSFADATYYYSFTVLPPFWLRWWFISLEIIFGVLLMILIVRIAQRRVKRKQMLREKLLSTQLTALRSQMNPHFVHNVLNSIQGLVYGGQKEIAAERIGMFSELMRKILDLSGKQNVNLYEEVETLKLYVEMERLRMPDFVPLIEVSNAIDLFQIRIPSLIVQPFVENAIKHGLYHKAGPKYLYIRFSLSQNNDAIVIDIEDNGIGRKASAMINQRRKGHQSFATASVNQRLELFEKVSGIRISLEIADKVNDEGEASGTLVKLTIPINH